MNYSSCLISNLWFHWLIWTYPIPQYLVLLLLLKMISFIRHDTFYECLSIVIDHYQVPLKQYFGVLGQHISINNMLAQPFMGFQTHGIMFDKHLKQLICVFELHADICYNLILKSYYGAILLFYLCIFSILMSKVHVTCMA